jgi:glucose/arabinose dehydrogenase
VNFSHRLGRLAARPSTAAAVALLSILAVPRLATSQAVLPDGFTDELVESNLTQPVGLAFLPDGRAFFVEQGNGRIRLLVNDAIAAIDPVGTVPNLNYQVGSERGLLGIAVDPEWPTRPYVYVHYTATGSVIRISRFTVAGDLTFTTTGALTIDPATRYDLIDNIPDNANNHNGGTVRFGTDGMLYVSLGEDAVPSAAQDTSSLRGVILRLRTSTLPAGPGTASRAQITPPDNPFSATGGLNARLIAHWGLRNPFRFGIDPASDDLFIADVGQTTWEELDAATTLGRNFGWPRFEANATFNGSQTLTGPHTAPIYAIHHDEGVAAITTTGAYRRPVGATRGFPLAYEGNVFVGDYYAGFLRRLEFDGSTWSVAPPVAGQPDPTNWAQNVARASDFGIAPDGGLWYVKQFNSGFSGIGSIRRIVPIGDTSVPVGTTGLVSFRAPYPSPSTGRVELEFTLATAARVTLAIHDVRGRLVRTVLPEHTSGSGRRHAAWDGLDDGGRRVGSGIYFVRLEVDGKRHERRVPLIR